MKIFISYAHVDEELVRDLVEILTIDGHEPWFDHRLVVARRWQDQLLDAIQACDRFLYALTPESFASDWCQWEFAQAVHADKPIVPVLLRDTQLQGALADVQYADFRERANARKATAHLLRGMREAKRINPADVPLISAPHSKPERPVEQANGGSGNSFVDRFLADVYTAFRAKEWGEAHELLTTCLDIEPDHKEAQKLLAVVRRRRILEILPQPFEWIDIPAGRVELEDRHGWFDVAAFAIAKYPITNAQYQVFVDVDDGYCDSQWWNYSDYAREWRGENEQPRATAFPGDDLPRVNVNWYDAIAFCRWLGTRIGEIITLPTEQQWQRAAQGDDGREYPWGNQKPDKTLCNFGINVGWTTPVTRYSDGASPYGVMDMVGNVWEWCVNEYGKFTNTGLSGDARRVMRGGSWDINRNDARAAYRFRLEPGFWNVSVGFRIVCSSPILNH